MAARARVSTPVRHEPSFDMRSLRRLAIWGTSATVALVMVVAASFSDSGSRRMMAAAGTAANAQMLASRSAEAEEETRRLADAVRALIADREQLVARLGALERNLEDATGSIRRQAAAASAAAAAVPPNGEAAAPSPAREAATPPAPEAPAAGSAGPTPAVPSPPERVANAPPAAAVDAPEPPKPDLGVDVGGAVTFDGLRALWVSTKGNNAALFEGLHPIVAVRENSRTKATELRLIVGPIANVEAATRLCETLSASRRYCQPVGFEGQRLTDAETVKPTPPKPARPAPPAPRPPRLFQ